MKYKLILPKDGRNILVSNKEKKEKGYFFTPEELNEYTANVIKQALFSASEFAELQYECGRKSKENCLAVFCDNCTEQIDRQSITNTFDETFNKFKV